MEENSRKNSSAKIAANNRYTKNHYKKITVCYKPDVAEEIKETAKAENKSVASYFLNLHQKHKEEKE